MTAVLPEFRDRGVGRRLKLFQRQDALKRGIDLIEWTFDPLDLKNGHFNLVRLGAVARRYIPDCYGVTGSPLHGGLPTDRLVAEWWLGSDRVKSILADDVPPMKGSAERVSVPANIAEIRESDRAAAARLQTLAREQFQTWFAKGYVATGVESRDAETDYLLEPAAAIAGLRTSRNGQGLKGEHATSEDHASRNSSAAALAVSDQLRHIRSAPHPAGRSGRGRRLRAGANARPARIRSTPTKQSRPRG